MISHQIELKSILFYTEVWINQRGKQWSRKHARSSLTRNRTAVQEISVSSLMFANQINQINQSKLGQKQFIGIVFPRLIT